MFITSKGKEIEYHFFSLLQRACEKNLMHVKLKRRKSTIECNRKQVHIRKKTETKCNIVLIFKIGEGTTA